MPETLIGKTIGSYKITRILGQGSFGEVYLAVHPTIERKVAIKVLKRELSEDSDTVTRFITEAKSVNKINHQNIVYIFDFGRLDDGRYFIIMEYLEGQSLRNLIKRRKRLEPSFMLQIARSIAVGLDAAHAKNIVHRDLKPDNIMVSGSSDNIKLKLLDFGIAKLLEKKNTNNNAVTKSGQILGTPAYMAPEQARAENSTITSAADIYSFGVIVYEMLTGHHPLSAPSTAELLVKLLIEPPEPIRTFLPEISPEIERIFNKVLDKNPQNRYKSAVEFYEVLQKAFNFEEKKEFQKHEENLVKNELNNSEDFPVAVSGEPTVALRTEPEIIGNAPNYMNNFRERADSGFRAPVSTVQRAVKPSYRSYKKKSSSFLLYFVVIALITSAASVFFLMKKRRETTVYASEKKIKNQTHRKLPPPSTWKVVQAGKYHACGIKTDNTLWCWGDNFFGQLGIGNSKSGIKPEKIKGNFKWKTIGVGAEHTCAITFSGVLYCWGNGNNGRLGTGKTSNSQIPVKVRDDDKWKTVSCGSAHTCGIKLDGSLWCWGKGESGRLGTGSKSDMPLPTQIGTETVWVSVKSAKSHTCGMKLDGSLWCWGENSFGELGTGSIRDSMTPERILSDEKWKDFDARNNHGCALTQAGRIYCWGENSSGESGLGFTSDYQNKPQRVSGLTGIFYTAGYHASYIISSSGNLWVWGKTPFKKEVITKPFKMYSETVWKYISAGMGYVCAIDKSGILRCAGDNSSGQLGTGTYDNCDKFVIVR